MDTQPKKLPVFGREISIEQLSTGLMVLGGLAVACQLFGFSMIGLALIVAAALAVMVWALHLHDLSQAPAERFRELRRLVQLRRSGDSEGSNIGDTPLPVVIILGCIIAIVCCHNFFNAYKQLSANDYPSVIGIMTRYEMVDIGMVSSDLEVEYVYSVAGQQFLGRQFRFLYRPYRVGTDQAKLLAANWQQGARIPVFYDPDNPVNAAIDNTFCKGDQLFVGLNIVGIMMACLAGGLILYFRWLKTARRPLRLETDAVRNTTVIKLSNVPLYGMFGLIITMLSFGLLFVALVGGLMSMGNGEIGWLVSAIDRLYVITGGLLAASLCCCAVERISYGRLGRTCEVDTMRSQITVRTEGFGDAVTIGFDQIESIRVVSSRDSWVRLGRTFSPTIFYRERTVPDARVLLQRNLNRNQAIELVNLLRKFVDPSQNAEVEAIDSFDGVAMGRTAAFQNAVYLDSPSSQRIGQMAEPNPVRL